MPHLPVVLFTDNFSSDAISLFDKVYKIEHPAYNFIDKIQPLCSSPFEKTIFLDTDTFICEDISPLFELLEKYDFVASFAPGRKQCDFHLNLPDYFPEFNTGLIAFRANNKTSTVLKSWLEIYSNQLKQKKPPHDQPAFREALYNSKASVFCLPSEYNFRTEHPNIGWANSTIKVIHGRHSLYEELGKLLNDQSDQVRLFFHDARFLQSDSIRFFNLKQNRSFLFKLILVLKGYFHRLIFRLNGDGKPPKRKGK